MLLSSLRVFWSLSIYEATPRFLGLAQPLYFFPSLSKAAVAAFEFLPSSYWGDFGALSVFLLVSYPTHPSAPFSEVWLEFLGAVLVFLQGSWHVSSFSSFSWDFSSLPACFFPSPRLFSVALSASFLSLQQQACAARALWESLILYCQSLWCVPCGSFTLSTSFFAALRLLCVLFYRFWLTFPSLMLLFGAFSTFLSPPPLFFNLLLRPPLVILSSLEFL